MRADRELDVLVAEKVMDWRFIDRGGELWSPSTDIAAAWDVVEKMSAMGFDVTLANSRFTPGFMVYFRHKDWSTSKSNESRQPAPLAICLAALRAVNGR